MTSNQTVPSMSSPRSHTVWDTRDVRIIWHVSSTFHYEKLSRRYRLCSGGQTTSHVNLSSKASKTMIAKQCTTETPKGELFIFHLMTDCKGGSRTPRKRGRRPSREGRQHTIWPKLPKQNFAPLMIRQRFDSVTFITNIILQLLHHSFSCKV